MSAAAPAGALRLLHVSDIHFGAPAVPAQVAAVEAIVADEPWDAIIVSGDVSQRARIGELQAARLVLDRWRRAAPLLVVPGNHDTAWWEAPLGLGDPSRLHRKYRAWLHEELEPVLRVEARGAVPGPPALAATLVGLCSAQGIQPATLTSNPRHLSVIGLVRAEQWARARAHFAAAPAGDARVLVLHHNLRRGRLSNRWGLRHGPESLRAFAASGAHVACCGHDHEEQLAQLTPDEAGPGARRPLVACAGTISNRSRGGRPSSINMLTVTAQAITATVRAWDGRTFVAGPALTVPRDG